MVDFSVQVSSQKALRAGAAAAEAKAFRQGEGWAYL